ncbi:acyl-CoA-binding domain-containing protein 4 [Sarracenia purpurea var. burkii]
METLYQWVGPPVADPRPKARYEFLNLHHGAAVIDDKMYIFGGNHIGRYLNDLQVLDLRSWTWSRVEVKSGIESLESPSPIPVPPRAGHSLPPRDDMLRANVLFVVKVFDLPTGTWSTLKTYGKPPVSHGGQSVTLVGSSLFIFGGQDAKRSLLNDLHILVLESMTWDEIDTVSKIFISRQQVLVVSSSRSGSFGGGVSHRVCAVTSRHYLLRFWSLCWFGLIAVLVSFAATLVALLFTVLEFLIGFVKQLLVLFQKLFSCLYYSSSSSSGFKHQRSECSYASSSMTDKEGFGTRVPGVVARLMGFDSLPASNLAEPFSTPFFDSQSLQDVHNHQRKFAVHHDHPIQKAMEPKPKKM